MELMDILASAIDQHDVAAMDHVIAQDPSILHKPNRQGRMPLRHAIFRGHGRSSLNFLMDCGAIPTTDTMLEASKRGDLDSYALMAERGGDINAKGEEGYNALTLASMFGNFRMVQYILHHPRLALSDTDTFCLVEWPCHSNHPVILRMAMEAGLVPPKSLLVYRDVAKSLHHVVCASHVEVSPGGSKTCKRRKNRSLTVFLVPTAI